MNNRCLPGQRLEVKSDGRQAANTYSLVGPTQHFHRKFTQISSSGSQGLEAQGCTTQCVLSPHHHVGPMCFYGSQHALPPLMHLGVWSQLVSWAPICCGPFPPTRLLLQRGHPHSKCPHLSAADRASTESKCGEAISLTSMVSCIKTQSSTSCLSFGFSI